MPNKGDLAVHPPASAFCPVCGWATPDLPWGVDGLTPSFDICSCCGVEWGYQDASWVGLERYRAGWLEGGAPWRDPRVAPDGLGAEERLLSAIHRGPTGLVREYEGPSK
jgi:hypothetical protein